MVENSGALLGNSEPRYLLGKANEIRRISFSDRIQKVAKIKQSKC